ncbi:MAG: TrkH family potassium uptake protein [Clostridiaceae bacterium]|jgi:trk system potassium uptake protein TrkH|nr:TrkH family potassium uptake protein [Clostridiaceae bacterium]
MNTAMISKNLGVLLLVEAASMLPSLLVAIIYKQNDISAFIITIIVLTIIGFIMYRIPARNKNFYTRDGFAIVSLGWILVSLFGALPFFISGAIPSYIDALFETVSGFTTTGSTILRDVESLPKGLLFWRSFTNWIGGMGVLVMMLAVLPAAGANTLHIMKAESPGPNPGKLVPKIGQSAKILYLMYIGLSLVQIVLLLIGGMPLFDTLIHTFSTAGTGGFSNMNNSVGAYNNLYFEIVIGVFMFLFGINFALYYQTLKGDIKSMIRDEEFRFYSFTAISAIVLITWNLWGSLFGTVWESLRHSFFQVSSIMTTTGFSSTNFDVWPVLSKTILIVLMFIGASAGSTGGGIKCLRFLLLFKTIKREVRRIIHPRAVYTVKYGGKTVSGDVLLGVMNYFFISIILFAISLILVSLDGFDMVSNFTAVAATINNIGPGLGMVGPTGNFADYSGLSKIVFSATMLFGRLEIYPMLILFAPTFWKRVNI